MNTSVNLLAENYGRSFDTKFNRQMPGYHKKLNEREELKKVRVIPVSFAFLIFKVSGFMAITALLLFLASSLYGDYVSKAGHTENPSSKQIIIGNDVILVPQNMVRYGKQRNATSVPRLDLYAHWPTLSGYSAEHAKVFSSLEDDAPIIFMTLEPRAMSMEMSGRVEKIYDHFFSGPPIEAVAGLVRRPFSKDSAYFSEDLYYEIGSPYPYAARCIRKSDAVAAPICIRDIHIGHGLTLTYRFHVDLLSEWKTLERSIKNKFNLMIAG